MKIEPQNPEHDNEQEHSSENASNPQLKFNPLHGVKSLPKLSDRRSPTQRIPQEALMCELGHVIDLSSGGMRILSKRPLKELVKAKVWTLDFNMTLDSRVAWSKRLGFRRHEIGLEFLNVDESVAKILGRLSASHRMRRAI